jgi:hypothetical protein
MPNKHSSHSRSTSGGFVGCVAGCFIALLLGAYPVPALAALLLWALEIRGHPGQYIYPLLLAIYVALPLFGYWLGTRFLFGQDPGREAESRDGVNGN